MPLYQTPDVSNFMDLFMYAQSVAPISQLTLLAVFMVSFIGLKKYEMPPAFMGSSFITFLTALFFYLMNLLDVTYVLGTAVMLGVSVIIAHIYREM